MNDNNTTTGRGWTVNGHTVDTYSDTIAANKIMLDAVNYLLLTTPHAYDKYLKSYNLRPSGRRWLAANKAEFSPTAQKNNRSVAFGLWLDNNTSNDTKVQCIRELATVFGAEASITLQQAANRSATSCPHCGCGF